MRDSVLNIQCFGGGLQSVAMAYAAREELLPRFDYMVFSDTGAEHPETYRWVDRVERDMEGITPMLRVSRGNLGQHVIENLCERRMDNPPFHTRGVGLDLGGTDPLIQKCTREYKSWPLERKFRELAGFKKGQRIPGVVVRAARGISCDEAHRMKASPTAWILATYPLVDELRWRRRDCETFLMDLLGQVPPKSACVFCPHTHPSRWRRLAKSNPDIFALVEEFDRRIRTGIPGCAGRAFVHRYRMPLGEAVESEDDQVDLFPEDFGCDEGLCGV